MPGAYGLQATRVALSMRSVHTRSCGPVMHNRGGQPEGSCRAGLTALGRRPGEGTTMPHERVTSRLELVAQADAAYWARKHTRSVLNAWRVPAECIDTSELAVSELVTNTYRHVTGAHPERPPARLVLMLHLDRIAPRLIVEVADNDARPPVHRGLPDSNAESGRGLF